MKYYGDRLGTHFLAKNVFEPYFGHFEPYFDRKLKIFGEIKVI